MTAEEKLNAATNALKNVLSAVQRHLQPNGISEREAIGEIIEAVDPWPLGDTVGVESKRTSEDKIKEVMRLVIDVGCAGIDYGANAGKLDSLNHAENLVEDKLLQLIKDDE